jgi:hypothetical protein
LNWQRRAETPIQPWACFQIGGDLPTALLAQLESRVLPQLSLSSQDLQHRSCPRAPETVASDPAPRQLPVQGCLLITTLLPQKRVSAVLWPILHLFVKPVVQEVPGARTRLSEEGHQLFIGSPPAICLASTPRSFRGLRGPHSPQR